MKKLFYSFVLLLLFIPVKAQVYVYRDMLDSIKNDTTFVAMKFPDAELSKEYITIIKKYWTLPTVIVPIKYAEVKQHAQLGNSFLALEVGSYHGQFDSEKPFVQEMYNYGANLIQLRLWTISAEKLKENRKKAKKYPDYWTWCRNFIATVDFSASITTIRDLNRIYQSDYDCGGYIYGWGKGYIKNLVQLICFQLNSPNEPQEIPLNIKGKSKPYIDKKDIGKLKYGRFFIPDYIFTQMHVNFGGIHDDEKLDPVKILKDYKFKYSVISEKEMNEKLQEEGPSFYYIKLVHRVGDRTISVVDSGTGKIIYSRFYSSGNFNVGGDVEAGDFEKLYEVISEN